MADTTWVLAFVWPRGASWDTHHDTPFLDIPWDGRHSTMHGGSGVSKKLQVGTIIEARFAGRQCWYPGVVSRVHTDGKLDIQYDDGDFEMRVSVDLVRASKVVEQRDMPKLQRQCAYLEQFIARYRTSRRDRFIVYTNAHVPRTLVWVLRLGRG